MVTEYKDWSYYTTYDAMHANNHVHVMKPLLTAT